jgi:lysophospholipase L1-like esterase
MAGVACAAPLAPKDVKLDGLKVSIVPVGQTVAIDPLPVLHFKWDGELKAGELSFRGPVLLPKCAWVFGSLRPGSLVITPADKPALKLAEGTDYRLDPGLAAVGGITGSKYAGANCHFEYDYTQTRLDLVEKTADGKVAVRKGQEDKCEPQLPEPSPGAAPLLSVYLAPNTTRLTMENINLIDPSYDGVPPVSGAEALKGVRAKLAAGQGATIVFLGDSITAQPANDFRDGKGSYVGRFAKYAETKYPDQKVVVTPKETVVPAAEKQIVLVKAGVGGDDTPRALNRFEADVLAHKPDVVVIMLGVNDENRRGRGNSVPVTDYEKNLSAMAQEAHGAGAAVIIMTTSMKNLKWSSTVGNLNEYAAAARAAAAARKCCLVDNFKAWENIGKRGLNYMVLLGTCLNHPIDRGHQIFFEGLRAAFEAP